MADVDATWTGTGEQEIVGTLKVNPDPYADQVVEIWMKTTIPAEYGINMEGMTVMNYITFHDFYNSTAEPVKLVCTTTIGDKWNHSVNEYDSSADIASMTTLYDDTTAIDPFNSPFKTSLDVNNYETESDDVDAWAICTVDLVLGDNGDREMAEALFGKVYDTDYGAKLFDMDGANPILLSESNFLIELPYPEYD